MSQVDTTAPGPSRAIPPIVPQANGAATHWSRLKSPRGHARSTTSVESLVLNQAMAALEMASAEVERQVAHLPIEAPASSLS